MLPYILSLSKGRLTTSHKCVAPHNKSLKKPRKYVLIPVDKTAI